MAALTRRAALAAGAATAVAMPAAAVPPPSAIAQLAARFEANRQDVRALDVHYFGSPVPPKSVALAMRCLVAESHDLRQQLAALPAVGIADMKAKARVLMDWLDPEWLVTGASSPPDYDTDQMLAWSLCRDLLAA